MITNKTEFTINNNDHYNKLLKFTVLYMYTIIVLYILIKCQLNYTYRLMTHTTPNTVIRRLKTCHGITFFHSPDPLQEMFTYDGSVPLCDPPSRYWCLRTETMYSQLTVYLINNTHYVSVLIYLIYPWFCSREPLTSSLLLKKTF